MPNDISLKSIPAWGWETPSFHFDKKIMHCNNAFKILGYFPFTGTLVAIIKGTMLVHSYTTGKKRDWETIQLLGVRSLFEITGLALVPLLIFDLSVTVWRSCKKSASQIEDDVQDEISNIPYEEEFTESEIDEGSEILNNI